MTGEHFIGLSRSGVYRAPVAIGRLRAAAGRACLTWFDLDLAAVADKTAFLAACARVLRFPGWFGANWDALADCLKDLPAGCLIYCRGAARFSAAAPADYATALEVFRDAASYFNESGSVFIVLLDQEAVGVPLPRLPGT